MSSLTKINTVIFDYGCVISHPQNKESVARIIKKLKIRDEDSFKKLYLIYRNEIDSGFITLTEYWLKTLKEINLSLPAGDIDWLVNEDMVSWADINSEMISLIVELKNKGINLAILSNMVTETLDFLKSNTAFIALFDHQFFSCNIKMVKPNPEIYKYCLNKMAVNAAECVFIDDAIVNCEAAGKLGIHPIHYTGIHHLKSELSKLIG